MNRLKEMLKRHEGVKLKSYICPAGRTSIGAGRNLEDLGITKEEADYLLENDIKRCISELSSFEWYQRLDSVRKDVLINMTFNLGISRLLGFRKMISALEQKDYERAAEEMLSSRWAEQVQKRAFELSQMMKVGEYIQKGE